MTCCVGMIVDDGLVMVADSRTNAGVDHVSIYRKMQVWEKAGERVLTLSSAGNLAITQATLNRLNEGLMADRGNGHEPETMLTVDSMRAAAQLVGKAFFYFCVRGIGGASLRCPHQFTEKQSSFITGQ